MIHIQLQQEILLSAGHSNPNPKDRTAPGCATVKSHICLAGEPGDPVAQKNSLVQDKQQPGIVSA